MNSDFYYHSSQEGANGPRVSASGVELPGNKIGICFSRCQINDNFSRKEARKRCDEKALSENFDMVLPWNPSEKKGADFVKLVYPICSFLVKDSQRMNNQVLSVVKKTIGCGNTYENLKNRFTIKPKKLLVKTESLVS